MGVAQLEVGAGSLEERPITASSLSRCEEERVTRAKGGGGVGEGRNLVGTGCEIHVREERERGREGGREGGGGREGEGGRERVMHEVYTCTKTLMTWKIERW